MYASIDKLFTLTTFSFAIVPCFSCSTSFRSLIYMSTPTVSMKPACSGPNISPAPRIVKSRCAILYPDPNSVKSLIAFNLFLDISDSSLSLLYSK